MRTTSLLIACGVLATSGACGGDPVDAAGDYSISVTSRENGCGFDGWTEDESTSNIGLVITQDGEDLTGTITGPTAAFLDLVLGGHVFRGSVDGDELTMELFGTRSATEGNCTYTVNATVGGTLDGDVLVGDILYKAATNGNPDCSTLGLTGCASRQEFNGTRPPQ